MVKLINLLEVSSSEFRTKLKTLGHKEKGSELTSGGELNPKLLDILTPFLDEWSKMGGNACKLQFTAGNDKFHQDRNSKHKTGDAVDVTLPTNCHTKFTELLNSYVKKYPGFVFIDEYKNPSKGATGGHFHLNIGGGASTTDNTTETPETDSDTALLQKYVQPALNSVMAATGIKVESIENNNQTLSENFINPKPNFFSSKIVAPYDGDVVEVDPSVCDGKIRIKHRINGLAYFTEFCNVNRPSVRTGESVRQNETIGDLGNNSLKVNVYDNNGTKYPISKFIKDSDKKPEEKVKTKTKRNSDYDSDYSDSKYPGEYTLPINALLTPLTIFNDMMSYKGKKKKVEEDEKINEEIDRIKELLK
jgi:hypothetical protein